MIENNLESLGPEVFRHFTGARAAPITFLKPRNFKYARNVRKKIEAEFKKN